MMRRGRRRVGTPAATALAVACGLAAALAPSPAGAIPSFARKYEVSCGTCHTEAYPLLNPWGRRFKENGYQMPPGAEEAARARTTLAPGAPDEPLLLLRELPLSVRATMALQVPTEPTASGRNGADAVGENLYVLVGGALYPDVSFMASASVAPQAVLHHAALGFHNLGSPEGYVNLRVGELLLLDHLRPVHREIMRVGNPTGAVAVGLNPTTLDSTQAGAEVFGRLFARRLFYRAAVVEGARGADGIIDLDSHKDLFGALQATLGERQTVGVLGYLGRTQITDSASGSVVRFTDPFWIAGVDAELSRGPVTFFGTLLRGLHDNPKGTGDAVAYWAGRAEIDTGLGRRALAILRYDRIHDAVATSLNREIASAHLSFSLLSNLRLGAEYDATLHDFKQSTVFGVIDVAL